jgi:hypothetical protein
MSSRLFKFAAVSLLALAAASSPAFADYDAGSLAAKSGNLAEAFRQWDVSARLGEARSQRALGLMLRDGHGVLQDFVAAHMWLNLAASQGEGDAARERDVLARRMSAEQVAEAQKRALSFKPSAREAAVPKVSDETVAAAPVEDVTEAPIDQKTASVAAPAAAPAPSPLAGLWLDKKNGFVISIEPATQGGGFVIKEALVDDKFSFPGDVIGEFRTNEIGDGYKGRHIWGGARKGDARWSDDGTMLVNLIDARTIRVKYTDSKYPGGWTYEKIR